jgi:hypothetical protein
LECWSVKRAARTGCRDLLKGYFTNIPENFPEWVYISNSLRENRAVVAVVREFEQEVLPA